MTVANLKAYWLPWSLYTIKYVFLQLISVSFFYFCNTADYVILSCSFCKQWKIIKLKLELKRDSYARPIGNRMQIIIFRLSAFKQLSRHLCRVRWLSPIDCLSQSATKTKLQKCSVWEPVRSNGKSLICFSCFCILFDRFMSLLKFNFISVSALVFFVLDMFCMVIS